MKIEYEGTHEEHCRKMCVDRRTLCYGVRTLQTLLFIKTFMKTSELRLVKTIVKASELRFVRQIMKYMVAPRANNYHHYLSCGTSCALRSMFVNTSFLLRSHVRWMCCVTLLFCIEKSEHKINYETKPSKAGSTLTTDMTGFPPDAQLQPAQAQGERVLQYELSRTQVAAH